MCAAPVSVFFPAFRYYMSRWERRSTHNCSDAAPPHQSFTLEVPPLSFTSNVFACLVWAWFGWFALGADAWAVRFTNTFGIPVCLFLLLLYCRYYKVCLYEKELKLQIKIFTLVLMALVVAFGCSVFSDGGEKGPSESVFYEVLAWTGMVSGTLV